MTETVSLGRGEDLPQSLRMAHEAIPLPVVQAMLRRHSGYNLGILMAHRHDDRTGDIQSLPEELTQVESSLRLSFQSTTEISIHAASRQSQDA
jgi:hypothetical protein